MPKFVLESKLQDPPAASASNGSRVAAVAAAEGEAARVAREGVALLVRVEGAGLEEKIQEVRTLAMGVHACVLDCFALFLLSSLGR